MAYTFKHGDRPVEGMTIQRAVGRGGFGEVYYALTDSGKQLAIKYLRENPEVELRGIAHVMNLKSPHLITIYDVRHNDAGDPFVIMEYVSGPSLRDLLIAESNGLGPQKAAFFVKGITAGLSYLHERGIVHRDLKPGNIFYDDGYVKIGDYGLSKHIAVSAHSGNTMSVGTVHYMAPEIGSGSYTKSIDIYALGVMLYEMLTGRLPFTGSSMGEILMRHLSDRPDMSGVPEPFADVIAKALAKDPKDRYQDADEMVDALTSVTTVSESLASFDASVLVQTPRTPEAVDHDRTLTTPPRRPAVAVLDARDDGDLPPIPPIPPVLNAKAARQARKLQDKARKLQNKAQQKARGLHAKMAQYGVGPAVTGIVEGTPKVKRRRWQQLVVAIIVLFAVSGGLGIYHDKVEVFGVSLIFLFLGTLGTLLANKLSARRNSYEYDFQDRLMYAACGFVFLLPAFAAGQEVDRYFGRMIFAMTGMLLLFNWNELIRLGRLQFVHGGTVFWHGILAMLISSVATDGRYVVEGGVLCATVLVMVQCVAGIWSLSPVAQAAPPVAGPVEPRRQRVWNHLEGVYQRVTNAVDGASERLDRLGKRLEKTDELEKSGEVQATVDPESEQSGEAARQQAQQVAMAQAMQPSFVGRTANAGLSFLAKLLLLAACAVALLFSPRIVDVNADGVQVSVSSGRVLVVENGATQIDTSIPRAMIFFPLLVGTVLLVVARRNDGAAHFLRGFLGCAAIVAATVMAIGPAAEPLGGFLSGQPISGNQTERLITMGIAFAVALVLLFWPKRREPGTIVI